MASIPFVEMALWAQPARATGDDAEACAVRIKAAISLQRASNAATQAGSKWLPEPDLMKSRASPSGQPGR
jgi:hypothetical protein